MEAYADVVDEVRGRQAEEGSGGGELGVSSTKSTSSAGVEADSSEFVGLVPERYSPAVGRLSFDLDACRVRWRFEGLSR